MPDPPSRTRLMITGASGYIGGRLVAAALARDLEVVAAVRDPRRLLRRGGIETCHFDLAIAADPGDALIGIGAVVHLAAVLDPRQGGDGGCEEVNVRGTERLLEAARRHGVRRFLFVSSQNASSDSPTAYGRAKWRSEQLLSGSGEVAVRPGLVSGGPRRGLYGQLLRRVKGTAVLPRLWPDVQIYPLHVYELCDRLLDLATGAGELPRLIHLGPAAPTALTGHLRSVARQRLGKRIVFLPVPRVLLHALPWRGAMRERLRGMLSLQPVAPGLIRSSAAVCPPTGPVGELLEAEGRKRRLAAEGHALMSYVLGRPIGRGVVRRYVRAVLADEDSTPLWIPPGSQALPCLLRLIDPAGGAGVTRRCRRFQLATRIVEMTPEAASRFHSYQRRSRPVVLLSLTWILLVEAALFPLRVIGRMLPRDESMK